MFDNLTFIPLTPEQLKELIHQVLNEGLTDLKRSQSNEKENTFLTRKQAAKLLQCSLPTLDKYIKLEKLKAYGLENEQGIRLKKAEVIEAMKEKQFK